MSVQVEDVHVPDHTTRRMTITNEAGGVEWVLTSIRTGCIRVQRGDLCAYLPAEDMLDILEFVAEHFKRTKVDIKQRLFGPKS